MTKLGRIAIWNKERFIVFIAMGVWLADVAFLIYGEYLLQIGGGFLMIYGNITGTAVVNYLNPDCFEPTRLIS